MKEGKWFDAIEQYDLAQRVAPNNMLIARRTGECGIGWINLRPGRS